MLRIIILSLLILASFVSAPFLQGKTGYVKIELANYVLEMQVISLVLFFLVVMLALAIIETIFKFIFGINKNYKNWKNNQNISKAQIQNNLAISKFYLDDFKTAQKLLLKAEKYTAQPLVNLIYQAKANANLGHLSKAQNILQKAQKLNQNDASLKIMQIEFLINENKFTEAEKLLNTIKNLSSPKILELQINIAKHNQDFTTLLEAIKKMQKNKAFSDKQIKDLRHFILSNAFRKQMQENGAKGILNWWQEYKNLHTGSQHAYDIIISKLIELDSLDDAQNFIIQALQKFKNQNIASLLKIISKIKITKTEIFDLLKNRKEQDPESIYLINKILGLNLVRNELFDKAKKQLLPILETNFYNADDLLLLNFIAEKTHDLKLINQIKNKQSCVLAI